MGKLFATVESFVEVLPGETNVGLDILQSTIDDVVERFIIPITSRVQYEALLTLMDAETGLTEPYEKLAKKIRKATAHLTMALAAPFLNVKASSGGFTVATGEKISIASSDRVRQYIEAMSANGQRGLDELIDFLDTNHADYVAYAASDEREKVYSNFINTTDQLRGVVIPMPGRWILEQMKGTITLVEDTLIKETIGKELYEHLKTLIKERTGVTTTTGVTFGDYAPLVPYIERAVANYSFAEAIDQLSLKVDHLHGVYISFYKNANEPAQAQSVRGTDALALKQTYQQRGERAMESLKKELLANLEDYPLYEASTAYTAPEENYTKNDDSTVNGVGFYGGS